MRVSIEKNVSGFLRKSPNDKDLFLLFCWIFFGAVSSVCCCNSISLVGAPFLGEGGVCEEESVRRIFSEEFVD